MDHVQYCKQHLIMFAQQLLGAAKSFCELSVDLVAHSYQKCPPALPLLIRAVALCPALKVQTCPISNQQPFVQKPIP